MSGPSMASMKFGFWLACVTFMLHCLLVPTAVTEMAERSYKVKRGVLRTGLMPREAYIPKSVTKKSKRSLCAIECSVSDECVAFNVDRSTGKCELFDTVVGGSLAIDGNWSYCGEISAPVPDRCILLIGGFPEPSIPVEYYHPIAGVECNINDIGAMSTERVVPDTRFTSGCYLSSTQEIVIQESASKPPMVYPLKDESAKLLPFPLSSTNVHGITAASVGSSKCISCGGKAGGSTLNNCYQFDPTLDDSKMTAIAQMPYQCRYAASVSLTINDYYVMGGDDGGLVYFNQMYRYDVVNVTWHAEAPMLTNRAGHAAAALSENEFIVCGGAAAGFITLSSCEIYDAKLHTWRNAGSLNQPRRAFAMINMEGEIYALGGFRESSSSSSSSSVAMNSVEKYDRATDEWKIAKAMQHPHSSFVGVRV